MTISNTNNTHILLALLPYWTPQIPPVGIACLQGYLRDRGYQVTVVDVNIKEELRNIYDHYFDALRSNISKEKRGNFYNIGHEVMQNHMMAHLNYQNKDTYLELIKVIIHKTFYFNATTELVEKLDKVLDDFYGVLEDYFIRLLEDQKPGVLGLSVYKGNLPASLFIFKLAKKMFRRIKTVMGGAVFAQLLSPGTPDFDFFLEKTEGIIDHLVVGEGEILFQKLLKGEFPDSKRVLTLQDIDNQTLDLEAVGLPDFSGLEVSVYPNMASYTSRSCPFQCKFCTETVYWGNYRKKSSSKIVNELTELSSAYGSRLFLLSDSLLNPVITGLANEFLNKDLGIYWDGYLRIGPETCDRENVYLWRRGGFYRARIGVESGSQRVLDAMNKHIPLRQTKTSLFNLANAGIKTTTYFIIGYPGETEEDFQQTLDFIEELKDDIYEAECNPFGYYPDGQVNSKEWKQETKNVSVYPENAMDLLIIRTWCLDTEPKRDEVFQRISRFVTHCTRLGIPNPYSLYDIHQADERWKKLHKNAVPSLVEFKSSWNRTDDFKEVEELYLLENSFQDAKDFEF